MTFRPARGSFGGPQWTGGACDNRLFLCARCEAKPSVIYAARAPQHNGIFAYESDQLKKNLLWTYLVLHSSRKTWRRVFLLGDACILTCLHLACLDLACLDFLDFTCLTWTTCVDFLDHTYLTYVLVYHVLTSLTWLTRLALPDLNYLTWLSWQHFLNLHTWLDVLNLFLDLTYLTCLGLLDLTFWNYSTWLDLHYITLKAVRSFCLLEWIFHYAS